MKEVFTTTTTPLRAVIYARFSSDNQREESIDAQVRACRDYCKKHGYLVTGIYKDEAKSGKTTAERDEYNRLQKDAEDDLFDIVIMHKIDRNARNEFDYQLFKKKMQSLGIRYEYAAQSIDDTPEGQMMENILVGFAAYYSRNLAKETKKGMNENAFNSVFNGGTPPLGYDILKYGDKGRYVINEAEAEIVRFIFDHYLQGEGYEKIATQIREKGWKTKRGGVFTKVSLHDILGNERYIGTYVFNKTHRKEGGKRNMHSTPAEDIIKVPNAFPAIISKEDFERAQAKRRTNQKRSGAYQAKAPYLLTGKVFCGKCGKAMCGHRNIIRGTVYEYYGCFRKHEGCNQGQVHQSILENAVIAQVQKLIMSSDAKSEIIKAMNDEYKKQLESANSVLEAKHKIKAGLETRLDNLYKLVEKGVCDNMTINRIKDLQWQITAVDDDIKKASAPLTVLTPEEIEGLFRLLEKKIAEDNLAAKRIMVDTFVERVTVTDSTADLTLSFHHLPLSIVPKDKTLPNVKISTKLYVGKKKEKV